MKDSDKKYSKWVFTLHKDDEGFIPQSSDMKNVLENISSKFVFQLERCPETEREHYQGCLVTKIRKRFSTLLNELTEDLSINKKYLTIDKMQGTFEQAMEYCSKEDTRVGDSIRMSQELETAQRNKYKGSDLQIFENEGFYPWQIEVLDIIFEEDFNTLRKSSAREVYWISDLEGNSGKSLFTKYLCFKNSNITKLAFGSGSQMRTGIIEEGTKGCYIIDIPRKLCNDDHKNNMYSVIEDLKNGFIKSSMYGNPRVLFMEPPIVIIFSNEECPIDNLSIDRWRLFSIIDKDLQKTYNYFLESRKGID